MKKLLFLLFPVFSYGQITITGVSNGYQTLGLSSISGISWTPNNLLIVFTGTTNSGGTPATVSLSGTGQTWTQIDNKLNVAGDYRIQAFKCVPTTTVVGTGTINLTYTGTQDGGWAIGFKLDGADITASGANAIVQFVSDAQNANANPTLTLSAISSAKNAVISGFINNQNPFGGAPESSWTEYGESGYNTPTTGGYSMYRTSTTDNTPTVTATSSNWAGIAIEIKASGRRATVIN